MWPCATHAQQSMPVVGFISPAAPHSFQDRLRAFHKGLKEAGYVEGQNVAIEYRWAYDQVERLPELAADLVRRGVSVIAALGGTPTALAAKAATQSIPVVFYVGVDPVERGIVAGLSRPGGNLTGVSSLAIELVPKRVEVLHELIPAATSVALLVDPANPSSAAKSAELARSTAAALALALHTVGASSEREFDAAFAKAAQLRAGAIVIASDALFNNRSARLAALSIQHSVPAAFQYREFVAAGGLISYGGSRTAPFHLAGVYVGRILKGDRPTDLPVQQETSVELIINLKTAKAAGIAVPLSLLGRADEVIE